MDNDYLQLIKSKVDELILKYGYGKIKATIQVKDQKVIYVVFETEERIKVSA